MTKAFRAFLIPLSLLQVVEHGKNLLSAAKGKLSEVVSGLAQKAADLGVSTGLIGKRALSLSDHLKNIGGALSGIVAPFKDVSFFNYGQCQVNGECWGDIFGRANDQPMHKPFTPHFKKTLPDQNTQKFTMNGIQTPVRTITSPVL